MKKFVRSDDILMHLLKAYEYDEKNEIHIKKKGQS